MNTHAQAEKNVAELAEALKDAMSWIRTLREYPTTWQDRVGASDTDPGKGRRNLLNDLARYDMLVTYAERYPSQHLGPLADEDQPTA